MKPTAKLSGLAVALIAAQSGWAQETVLGELMVTAQRREESLQDAAVAIDALSGDTLVRNGITDAYELGNAVPALHISAGGGMASHLYMRGVGNRANNSYLDPAIIMTYDGVVMARGMAAGAASFFDLARVEVLKGPQGTLYGKNATGGVINIIPVAPQLGETSGFVNLSYGNYSDQQLQAALNLPLGANSALRISGSYHERDGYNRDGTSDADSMSVRAQFLAQPTDGLSVRIAADYADLGGVGNGTTAVGNYAPRGLGNYVLVPSGLDPNEGQDTPAGNAYRVQQLVAPGFGFLIPIQDQWYLDGELKGVNAEIVWDTGAGTFTFIPAWRNTFQDSKFGTPAFNSGWWVEDVTQKSLEVRLARETGGLLDYLVGAFYMEEEVDGDNTFNQEFVLPMQEYHQEAESWALFGNLTWNLTDRMRLVTGARYTDDQKGIEGAIDNYITFCGGPPPGLITPPASFAHGCAVPGNLPHFPTLDSTAEADQWLIANGWAAAFIPVAPGVTVIPLTTGVATILHVSSPNVDSYDNQKTTYRVSMEWDALEDSMFYLSYETGYRSGGFQLADAATYKPEYLDAYTFGAKNRFAGGRVQLNAELFYWNYKDQQISYFTLTSAGVLENLTDNVGKATVQGADIDLLWLVTERTLLSGKVQYLDATYDDLHFITAPPRDNINCPFVNIGTTSPRLDFDCSGSQAAFAPEWTVQFGIEHTFELGAMELVAALDTTWTADQVTGFWNLEHEVIQSHAVTNLDLTLVSANDTWSVSAYARNLEDKRRIQSTQASPMGLAMAQYGPVMTYGVRFNYKF